MSLSIVMVTREAGDVIEETLKSVAGLWDELLVDDAGSKDRTVEIVKKYGGKIFREKGMTEKNLGERKQELVERAKGDWILVLDADERVSKELYREIIEIQGFDKITLKRYFVKKQKRAAREMVAYRIPYQNYVFGKSVYWGGERYSKVRLFRRGFGKISPVPLHEEVIVTDEFHRARPSQRLRPGLEDRNVGELRGVIHHHSFRTPWQLFGKFTQYAWVAAGELDSRWSLPRTLMRGGNDKRGNGDDGMIVKKLFLYGPHMFWARYVKEKGYRDGWRGLVLATAFGYMEGLTYWLLLIRKIFL